MKLYDSGVYLVNGKEIMTDAAEVQQKTGKAALILLLLKELTLSIQGC